jgi:phospho-2-dehydro-3-deoxyheptonate aldolase
LEKNYIHENCSAFLIGGPCAVENYQMIKETTEYLLTKNITNIRANIFKPRTSPNSFQGLGLQGLKILSQLKKTHNVNLISEIVDTRHIELMIDYVDIFQVGSRNMSNFELLKELGRIAKPVLLKRGMSATIEEFICAAEYIIQGGNKDIYLCERGIRSFDNATRNTLDLSCVPLLKNQTELPVIVDLNHSLGRKDIIVEMGKAALACGADGLMLEVHPDPQNALSDEQQQLNFKEFENFHNRIFTSKK